MPDQATANAVRIAAIADLHIGARHMGKLLESGRHSALVDQERALDFVVDTCRRENVSALLIAGDTTHSSHPDIETLAILGRFYRALADAGIAVVVVAGNHDPALPSVTSEFRGTIHAVSTPQLVRLDGLDVACLPWLPDRHVRAQLAGNASREDIAHALTAEAARILRGLAAERREGVPMVLLTHATIAGSVTSTGFDMGSVRSEWAIDPSDLQDFDLTIAGHVHKPQFVAAGRAFIPGSLQPLDFSETQERRMLVLDVTTGWSNSVAVPARALSAWDVTGADLPEIMAGGGYTGDGEMVRVRASLTRAEAQQYPASAITKALYERGAHLVQVEYTIASEDRARDGEMRAGLSPMEALERYVEQTEAPERMLVMADAIAGSIESRRGVSGIGGLALQRLELRNFMSIREADITFTDEGVVAITGPSGSGKSAAICDALRWALGGASRYGEKGSDRLIRRGEREASVAVTFAAEDGRSLRVVRRIKKSAGGRATSTLDVLVGEPAREREAVHA